MKIYVVFEMFWDGDKIVAIFREKEDAEFMKSALNDPEKSRVEEFELIE